MSKRGSYRCETCRRPMHAADIFASVSKVSEPYNKRKVWCQSCWDSQCSTREFVGQHSTAAYLLNVSEDDVARVAGKGNKNG